MKRITSFLAALLLCLSMAQPAWAASETQVDNGLQTGDVRIAISDELNLGKKTVLPGDEIGYSVSIENQAESAWLRARVMELPDWLDMDHVTVEKDWEPHGEYYYYKKIVDSESSVKFISGITVPDTLGNEMQGAEFKISVSAEAVQSEHFEPDFGTEDPWFGTVVEVCTDEGAYDPGATGTQSFQVIYEDGSQGLIHVGDDFFANWDRLMPGDVMTGTVEVKNNYSPAEIFFRTENIVDGTSGEGTADGDEGTAKATSSDLLAQLNLKIENGGQVVYDGPMSGIASPTSLGDYSVGSSTTLKYTVTMPKQLRNAYSLSETRTRWIFSVEPSDEAQYEFPKTGGPGIYGYAAAGTACMMLAAAAVLARKKGGADHA